LPLFGDLTTGTPRTISSKSTEENKFRRNTRNSKQNKGELKNDPKKTVENQKKLEKSRRTRKSYKTKRGKQTKKKLQKAKNKFQSAPNGSHFWVAGLGHSQEFFLDMLECYPLVN
jgi:hypothetical protein